MKKFIKNIALFASMATLVGCVAEPTEVVDSIQLNRCLAPTNLVAEIVASVGTDVELTWDAMEGTEYYTVEVFESTSTTTDEEGNEIAAAPDFDTAPPFKTETEITEIPHIVSGLEVDKSYFVRVKGHATNVEDSHWTVLEEAFATSAVRSQFKLSVSDRTDSSITVTWAEGEDPADLTTLRAVPVSNSSKKSVDVALTEEMISARTATVSGLDACTDYKLSLIYGKACNRGNTTAFTRPSTDGAREVASIDELNAALTGATGALKIKLAYNEGIPYDLSSVVAPIDDLYIYGQSTTDGKKPTITGLDLQPTVAIGTIHIEDVVLDGAVYGVENAAAKGNIMTNTAGVGALEIVNCEVFGYTKGIIYIASGSSEGNVGSLLVDGCYFHDINADGTVGGDFIDMRSGVCPKIVIQNSTFYACARTFLRVSDNCDSEYIEVKNCTFNFVTTTKTSSNNAGIFGVRTKTTPTTILCTKNVFLNQYSDGEAPGAEFVRLVRNSSDSYAPVCSGNIFYNVGAAWFVSAATTIDGAAFDEAAATAEGGQVLDSDPCQSSGAGKLYLSDNSPIANVQAGDPRWWNAAIPEPPVRATELEVAEQPYTWDFTLKSVYDGETLNATTIIGNARIYASAEAPTEVKLGEGVYFAEAGILGADGAPMYGAIGILTEGYGAVVVTATGDNGVEGVQVMAGGDRYTILADGEPHKVLLGDLVGQNNIYIVGAGGVTIKQIEWNNSTTPDATATALKTPGVSLDPRKVDLGTAQAVVASWAAVENANTYEVMWKGQPTVLDAATTSFTIAADEVAALSAGEYTLSVVAKPVETSSKYLVSEAGEAILTIVKPVVGGEVTLKWGHEAFDDIWVNGCASNTGNIDAAFVTTNMTAGGKLTVDADGFTYDGLQFVLGGGKFKFGQNNNAAGEKVTRVQFGGSGNTGKQVLIFEAPAAGTLKVEAISSGDTSRPLKVAVDGTEVASFDTPDKTATPQVFEVDCTTAVAGSKIYIYSGNSGINLFSVEYTYVSAPVEQNISWGHAAFDDIWVNGCASNTGNIDAAFVTTNMTAGGKLTVDADGFTYDGLQFVLGGGKFKFGQNNNAAGEKVTRVQFGGTGNTGKAVIIFEAPAAGTLKVEAISSGDTSRPLKVAVDGTEVASFDTPDKTGIPQVYEVDCTTAVAGSKIYIYSGNSGINLFSIDYTYTK